VSTTAEKVRKYRNWAHLGWKIGVGRRRGHDLCSRQYSQTQDIIRDILLGQNLNSTISGGRMNISDIYIRIYSRLDIFLEGFVDVHQLPMGYPYIAPIAQAELVLHP
jgi:hypothetical protein